MYMSANTPNAPICALYVLLRITLMVRIEAVCEGTNSLVWRFLCFFSLRTHI